MRSVSFSMHNCYSNVEPAVVFAAMRNAEKPLESPTFEYYIKAVLQKEMGYSYKQILSYYSNVFNGSNLPYPAYLNAVSHGNLIFVKR